MEHCIDYVVSYIDYTQKEIVELWEKTTSEKYVDNSNHDYIDFSLVLGLILKNMPFLNKIYVICKDAQVLTNSIKHTIDKSGGKIVRVNESEIMPNNYITFSSACIEMFIWKIPGLAEYFLYANDDMIPLKPCKKEWFYEEMEDGTLKPFMSFKYNSCKFGCLYNLHCSNATNLIFDRRKNNDEYYKVWTTAHTIRPLKRSICEECFNLYENFIMSSLHPVRFYNNLNMDLYMLYGFKKGYIENKSGSYFFRLMSVESNDIYMYETSISKNSFRKIPDIVCINDGINIDEKTAKKAKKSLKKSLTTMKNIYREGIEESFQKEKRLIKRSVQRQKNIHLLY